MWLTEYENTPPEDTDILAVTTGGWVDIVRRHGFRYYPRNTQCYNIGKHEHSVSITGWIPIPEVDDDL